jgi:SAM-dependent methyltransferase
MSETAVLPPKAQTETPESWFHRRATSYVEAQILFHLNQAGVFGLLRKGGAQTAPQIAESLSLDPAATDALLDYVFEVDDLLERDGQQKYSLSEFGRKVVDRYSDGKAAAGQQSINMFDVRVGAYGPVWQNLGRMLTREGTYGRDFHREGRYAENGVFKLAMQFWNSLVEHVDELNVESVLEVGLTTGLLDKLAERYPGKTLYGLDRNAGALERTAANLAAKDTKDFRLIQGDYFAPEEWSKQVDASRRGMIFSLHFHELIAGGEHKFVDVLRSLRRALPGWVLVAFEQPRLPHDDRGTIPETLWLYSQSNILIHHLIGNGRILSREAWIDLGRQAGCRPVTDRPCNYLGYRAFVYEL